MKALLSLPKRCRSAVYASVVALAAVMAASQANASPAQTGLGPDGQICERQIIDSIVRVGVLIDASPDEIWPHIVRTRSWKQYRADLVPLDPAEQGAGAIFAAVSPDRPDDPYFYVVNVEFVTSALRTIKLVAPEDGSLIGYATWRLLPQLSGATLVTYDVMMQETLPGEGSALTCMELKARSEEESGRLRDRYILEFSVLKKLVEAAGN